LKLVLSMELIWAKSPDSFGPVNLSFALPDGARVPALLIPFAL